MPTWCNWCRTMRCASATASGARSRTGLVIKLQTLDGESATWWSSRRFPNCSSMHRCGRRPLAQMMTNTAGYRVEKLELERTSRAAEGWALKSPVAGFKPMQLLQASGRRRQSRRTGTVQWTFSDGLASVSLFIERYDRQRAHQRMAC
jgi:sigma-E factor negative regulatory protein RseB